MSNNTNTNVGSDNSVLGSWALSSATNDTSCNSAFGSNSLLKHTKGSFNTSLGAGAMTFNITGNRNVAVGSSALEFNTNSENNTAIGTQALFGKREGSNNTAIGINAGLNDVSGSFNTYLGANTGTDLSATPYTNSTAIGYGATINASNRIVLGTAGQTIYVPGDVTINGIINAPGLSGGSGGGGSSRGFSVDDQNNTYVGLETRSINTQSNVFNQKSTAVGYRAEIDVSNQIVLGTSGEFVCIPSNRGLSIGKTTAPASGIALDVSGAISINKGIINYSIAPINYSTGVIDIDLISYEMIFPNLNVSLFTNSELSVSESLLPLLSQVNLTNNMLYNLMLGFPQIGLNYDNTSMYDVKNGFCNVALGAKSLSKMTRNEPGSRASSYNTSIGSLSQMSNNNGSNTTTLGARSLVKTVTGANNVAVWFEAGWNDISGSYNTYLGSYTKIDNETNIYQTSTAIGYGATITNQNQIVLGTSGEFVCIPSNRGLSIGKATAPTSNYALDVSGSINFLEGIYKNGVPFVSGSSSSNSISSGLFVLGDISGNGKLDITGDISGNSNLSVRGSVGASSYNATSDYRIKDNVRNLDEQDTISNLRPVKYFNKQTNKNDFGLIAHELQSEYPDLVSGEKDGQELQSVNYIGLISVLIKEVQELKQITAEQAIEISTFKKG